MIKILIFIFFLCVLTQNNNAQTVTDIDGNVYNTVTIGMQVWMKENLKTTKYNDGNAIPNVTDNTAWNALTTHAYCWYDNLNTNKATYGAMYNGYAVNTGKLCPANWHVPSMVEWTTLVNFLGGQEIAGGKMKESGTAHWRAPNPTSNSCGFLALPGGFRRSYGFIDPGIVICWWGIENSNTLNTRYVQSDVQYCHVGGGSITDGYYVRCLKDSVISSSNIIDNSVDKLLYPNPAYDKLYIKTKKLNGQIIIFDLQGKQVVNRHISSDYIDISNLSKGVYLVKIIDTRINKMWKLIKE